MPTTVPGFLLVSGLLMLLLGLFGGGIKFKDVAVPAMSKRSRLIVAVLGIAFMVASFLLYNSGVIHRLQYDDGVERAALSAGSRAEA